MKLEKVKKYTLWDTDSGNKAVTIEESLEEDFDYFFRGYIDQYTRDDLIQVANFILEVVKDEQKESNR